MKNQKGNFPKTNEQKLHEQEAADILKEAIEHADKNKNELQKPRRPSRSQMKLKITI